MGSIKVYVTRRIPEIGIGMLEKEGFEVSVRRSVEIPTKKELLVAAADSNALLCLLTDQVDSKIIEAARNLTVISNYAVGYDNIDVAAATKRGIMVTNTPGVLTETTADMAWALLMALARRVVEGDAYTRKGLFKRWEPRLLLGCDVHGKTLGIIGLGRIGRAVASRAKGFKMKVVYTSRHRAPPEVEEELQAEYVDLPALLEVSDFISIHTPLTPETHHMIGAREIEMMKPSCYLVNTSRGPVVDEQALAKALVEGRIAGAALDVFEHEPKVTPELMKLANVVLTPHLGSASVETRGKMSEMAARNIIDALQGRRPPNLVNPEVLG